MIEEARRIADSTGIDANICRSLAMRREVVIQVHIVTNYAVLGQYYTIQRLEGHRHTHLLHSSCRSMFNSPMYSAEASIRC